MSFEAVNLRRSGASTRTGASFEVGLSARSFLKHADMTEKGVSAVSGSSIGRLDYLRAFG